MHRRRAGGFPDVLAAAALAVASPGLGCTERIALEGVSPGGSEDAGDQGPPADDGGLGTKAEDSRTDRRNGEAPCPEVLKRIPIDIDEPDLVVALERSATMLSAFGASTRLAAAQTALLAAMKTYHGAIHFGYAEFPSRRPC